MALAIGTLAVCGSAAQGTERAAITLWFWGASPAYRQALDGALVKPFNERQQKYTLIIEYRTTVDSDVRIAAIANRGPDLVYTSGPGTVTPLARAGKLAPLDAYAKQYGWSERLLAPVLGACRQLSHLYCVPPSLSVNGMFYNKAVLRENGWAVPTSRQDVESIMKAAQAKGLYGSVTGNSGWQPSNEDYLSIFFNQILGPAKFHDLLTGRLAWSSPDAVGAMSELDRWFKRGFLGGEDYFVLDFDTSLALLHQKQSPFFFAPNLGFQWAVNYFKGADADDLGFAPFPQMNPSVPYPLYDVGSAFTLSINANSTVKDGAAEVLDMILSPEFVLAISRQWPGYWSIPLKRFPDDPGALGVARAYYRSMVDVSAAVSAGSFGYNAASYIPNATKDLLIQDLESVWLDQETPRDMLIRADRVFTKERARGFLIDDIPAAPIPNVQKGKL
ncbi:MAG: raffinose/stachyose/melibiose transport system substrate-binding protein [Gammaproteobacteria bacterium]|nr:raffinose/stachyose/melibiose transport system substrate-binding protein [Gammaproteobacteria bacterium]